MLQRYVDFEWIDDAWYVTFTSNYFGSKQTKVVDYLQSSQEANESVLISMATATATQVGIPLWLVSQLGGFTVGAVIRRFNPSPSVSYRA
ncbi:MAG: hypothetical protein DRI24_17045 [Deltaproteobacteria bacterium]|nr:MAG: hypothetical protein DRI24_17045 [Deltaproteobacteria bacterium]